MATPIRVSIEINATPDDVWAVLEPIERHIDWMADAESITFTSQTNRGVGTSFICVTKVGPIRLNDVMRITEWSPGSRMGVSHHGIVTGSGRFILTPGSRPGTTNFTWDEALSFPWWLGGPIAGWLGGQIVLRAIWRKNLRRLKILIERSG